MFKTCSCHGVWRSNTTRSWPPGTTAKRPAWRTKWKATGWLLPWTTAAAPSPSLRWGRTAGWVTSTPSPPPSPSRCVWASDFTRRSSTVASPSSSRPEEQTRHARQDKNRRERRRWFASLLPGLKRGRCSLMSLCSTCNPVTLTLERSLSVKGQNEYRMSERGETGKETRATLKQIRVKRVYECAL